MKPPHRGSFPRLDYVLEGDQRGAERLKKLARVMATRVYNLMGEGQTQKLHRWEGRDGCRISLTLYRNLLGEYGLARLFAPGRAARSAVGSFIYRLSGAATKYLARCDREVRETATAIESLWWRGVQHERARVVYWRQDAVFQNLTYTFGGTVLAAAVVMASDDSGVVLALTNHMNVLTVWATRVGESVPHILAQGNISYWFEPFPYPYNVFPTENHIAKEYEFSASGRRLACSYYPHGGSVNYPGRGDWTFIPNGVLFECVLPADVTAVFQPGYEPAELVWSVIDDPRVSVNTEAVLSTRVPPTEETEIHIDGVGTFYRGQRNYVFPLCYGGFYEGEVLIPVHFTFYINHEFLERRSWAGYDLNNRYYYISETCRVVGLGIDEVVFTRHNNAYGYDPETALPGAPAVNTLSIRRVACLFADRKRVPRAIEIQQAYDGSNDPMEFGNYYWNTDEGVGTISEYRPYTYTVTAPETRWFALGAALRPLGSADIQDQREWNGPADYYFNSWRATYSSYHYAQAQEQIVALFNALFFARRDAFFSDVNCDVLSVRVNPRITGENTPTKDGFGIFVNPFPLPADPENPEQINFIAAERWETDATVALLVPSGPVNEGE